MVPLKNGCKIHRHYYSSLGANIEATDPSIHETPLHLSVASNSNQPEIVSMLLKNEAKIECRHALGFPLAYCHCKKK